MTDKFVQVAETKTLNHVVDGEGPGRILMSLVPGDTRVHLVIGARLKNAYASSLNKKGIEELIDILKDIRDCLKD